MKPESIERKHLRENVLPDLENVIGEIYYTFIYPNVEPGIGTDDELNDDLGKKMFKEMKRLEKIQARLIKLLDKIA